MAIFGLSFLKKKSAHSIAKILFTIKCRKMISFVQEEKGEAMYNSPIKTGLMYRELVKEVNKDTDEQIYKAVVACGVDVDRDELLRALAYDRGQYDAGFAAGYRAATPKWIPVEERLPETTALCIVVKYCVPTLAWYTGKDWRYAATASVAEGITHWMPLPQPPKEVE